MAKDVITRFKLETTQYDSALRDAAKELTNFTKTATQAGKGFDDFTKASVEAARALGQTASGATNVKERLKDTVSAFNNVAKAYNQLTDAQKQSDFGKAMAESLEKLQQRIKDTKLEIQGLGDSAKGSMQGMMDVFGGNMLTKATEALMQAGSAIGDMITESTKLAQEAEGVAIAFERLAKPELMNQLKEATHGTVSEMELMKAAVKFDDFKLNVDELGTLLAFAQQKAKDTGQSVDYMVDSIVTGLGRQSLMILDNLGLSAAEIKDRMKEGGDMTTAVASIIRDQMAKSGGYIETAADQAARAAAEQQDAMVSLGRELLPLQQGATAVFGGIATATLKATAFLVKNKEVILTVAAAVGGYTLAVNANVIATKAWSAATSIATTVQKAFNVAAKANPIGLLVGVTSAAAAAFGLFSGKSDEATDAMKRQAREAERLRQVQQQAQQTIGNAVGGVEAKFMSLQTQWKSLKSDQQKIQFIHDQKDAFAELGLKINSVAQAQEVLVNQAPKVIAALKSVAEAEAYSDLYKQAIQRKATEWDRRTKTGDTGDKYARYVAGQPISDEEAKAAGVRTNAQRTVRDDLGGMGLHTRVVDLNKAEVDRVNAYRNQKALELKKSLEKGYDDEIKDYGKKWEEAQKTALSAQKNIAGLIGSTGSTGGGSRPSARATAVKVEEVLPVGSIAEYTARIRELQTSQSLVTDTESWKKLQEEINGVTYRIKLLKGEIQPETGSQRMQNFTEGVNASAADLAASITKGMTTEAGKSLVDAGAMTKTSWEDAAKAIASAGTALQGLKEPSIKVAAIVGQAVANIALGFSKQSLAAAGGGPWAWIAAIAGGLGTMVSTIAAIKSATKGYSTGGRIEGNSYSGDNLLMPLNSGGYASLNAGEIVLNRAQTNNLANALTPQPVSNGGGAPYLTGELIFLGANNHLGRTGQGEIVTTSMLRSYGLIG